MLLGVVCVLSTYIVFNFVASCIFTSFYFNTTYQTHTLFNLIFPIYYISDSNLVVTNIINPKAVLRYNKLNIPSQYSILQTMFAQYNIDVIYQLTVVTHYGASYFLSIRLCHRGSGFVLFCPLV